MSVIPTPPPGTRRLRWAAAIAVAGVVLGGGMTVLLGILALLLVLDAVVPVPGRVSAGADERFLTLVRRRRAADRRRRLRGLPPERLDVLDDHDGWAATAERRSLGVLPVPVASIRGTVEGSKAAAFDRAFRPEPAARLRWERLWVAWERGTPLPPIAVYRVGQEHYVRDGHHRVSVALDHHAPTIDAEVVELRVPGAPGRRDARVAERCPA